MLKNAASHFTSQIRQATRAFKIKTFLGGKENGKDFLSGRL